MGNINLLLLPERVKITTKKWEHRGPKSTKYCPNFISEVYKLCVHSCDYRNTFWQKISCKRQKRGKNELLCFWKLKIIGYCCTVFWKCCEMLAYLFQGSFLTNKIKQEFFLSLFIAAKAKLRFKFDALCWSWSRLQILAPKICIHIKNPLSFWPGSKAMDVYSKKFFFLQCWTICKILCCQLQNWAQI